MNNVKLSGSYQGGLYVLTVQYGNTNDEQTVVSISHSSLEKCANFIDWIIKNEK